MPAKPSPSHRQSTRDTIKKVATEALIRHGFHNTSFRDIADEIGTTTTNIHYHFGNKQLLVAEVIKDYVEETAAMHRSIWLDPAKTLSDKLHAVIDYNHKRYRKFNRGKAQGLPWSLIGRLRLDSADLSPASRDSLASFSQSVHDAVAVAFEQAARSGELRQGAPLDDLALLVVNLVNSSSVFTQDAGSFDRLQQFFLAFERVMLGAYAGHARLRPERSLTD